MTTYGYTIDELAHLMITGTSSLIESRNATVSYNAGDADSITEDMLYDNRITLASVMMNEKDKQFATTADAENLKFVQNTTSDNAHCNVEPATSGEMLVVHVSSAVISDEYKMSPYDDYLLNM